MDIGELSALATDAVVTAQYCQGAGLGEGEPHLDENERTALRVSKFIENRLFDKPHAPELRRFRAQPFKPEEQSALRKAIGSRLLGRDDVKKLLEAELGLKPSTSPKKRARRREPKDTRTKAAILGLTGTFLWVTGLTLPNVFTKLMSNPAWAVLSIGALKLLLVAAGIALLGRSLRALRRMKTSQEHKHSHIYLVPERAARKLQRDAGTEESVNAMQADVFTIGVLRPTDIRQRIVETYIPNGTTVRQQVSIEVQLPLASLHDIDKSSSPPPGRGREPIPAKAGLPADLETVYFPVLLPEKGTLQDNFDVTDRNGTPLHVLSYREYLKVAAGTLRLILATGFATRTAKDAELNAVHEIAQRRSCTGFVPPSHETRGWEQLLTLAKRGGAGAQQAGLLASALARKLYNHYAVVVIAHPDPTGRFIVKYEQTIIPTEVRQDPTPWPLRLLKAGGWLASALGAKPLRLVVGLKNASTCQSYHARATCPDHLYLGRQELSTSARSLQSIREDAPTPAYIRFRKRLGQSYGHFYARFFPELSKSQDGRDHASIKFSFYEVPPASVFRSAVAAIAAFLLVWSVAVVMSRRPDAGTDAPALLLAFPAVAATLIGADSPSRGLFDSTMAARLSLIGTAIVSVSSSALFMVYKTLSKTEDASEVFTAHPGIPQYVWPRLPDGWALLGVTNWPWILLTFLALVNACVSFWTYVARFAYYAYLGKRKFEEFEYSTSEVGDISI